jgi:hypothetical protein
MGAHPRRSLSRSPEWCRLPRTESKPQSPRATDSEPPHTRRVEHTPNVRVVQHDVIAFVGVVLLLPSGCGHASVQQHIGSGKKSPSSGCQVGLGGKIAGIRSLFRSTFTICTSSSRSTICHSPSGIHELFCAVAEARMTVSTPATTREYLIFSLQSIRYPIIHHFLSVWVGSAGLTGVCALVFRDAPPPSGSPRFARGTAPRAYSVPSACRGIKERLLAYGSAGSRSPVATRSCSSATAAS